MKVIITSLIAMCAVILSAWTMMVDGNLVSALELICFAILLVNQIDLERKI